VGKAIAEGLNQNVTDMTLELMSNLDEVVGRELAAGLGVNPQLLSNIVSRLDGNVGLEVAAGLNENTFGFLEQMLASATPELSQAIVDVINDNYGPPKYGTPFNMDNVIAQLIRNLGSDTAQAIAQGLNANPVLVEHLLRNLDGELTAEQMNLNLGWTIDLVSALDGAALAGAINDALATAGGQQFVIDLLDNLNGEIVANAMNDNPRITEELLEAAGNNGLGTVIGQAVTAAGAGGTSGFLTELLGNLDHNTMISALTQSLGNHSLDLPIPGHNLLECLWLDAKLVLFGWVAERAWLNFIGFEVAP
jgi:hypothetical protein